MKKLNMLGIGPRIGIVALPYFAVTVFLSLYFKEIFSFGESCTTWCNLIGAVLVFIGLVLYVLTVRLLLKGIRTTTLQTKGTYALCQNPLYAAIILFIIPGTSLLINTWLILTTSVLAYVIFKLNIKSEYAEMESVFGEEYRQYRSVTPEFFPIAFLRWL